MQEPGRFIAAIAAVPFHPESGTYLLLRRSEVVDVNPGEWEVVTGRVQQGESFEEAVLREAREELGVPVLIDFLIGTSHFFRGPERDENEVLGVRYACTVADREAVALSREHDDLRWLVAAELGSFLPPENRARQMIERAELLRNALPVNVVQLQRREGFLSQ